jgi:hypothetical protein
MYGMVNQAVRGLVLKQFGEDAWRQIHTQASAPEAFVSMNKYDDDVTYRMVDAAVDVLGLHASDILKAFGRYWVSDIATAHYADMMSRVGVDFIDFMKNLDHMHSRIRTTFPDYVPPSFRITQIAEGRCLVDYYSARKGLLPFVEGLLLGVAEHFEVNIQIDHIPDEAHPMPCKRMEITYTSTIPS